VHENRAQTSATVGPSRATTHGTMAKILRVDLRF
jgi:hypothetical protein